MGCMEKTGWQKRISRAQALAHEYPFAGELLNFYRTIVEFQQGVFERIERASANNKDAGGATRVSPVGTIPAHMGAGHSDTNDGDKSKNSAPLVAGPPELSVLLASFPSFLALVEKHGPPNLAEAARHLRSASGETQSHLLNDFWDSPRPSSNASDASASETIGSATHNFFARAFLQPYAEFIRMRADSSANGYSGSLCPFCGRKPGVAVLRPLGDGGQRRLVCSFCLAEWEFRRIVCANCGEEDHKNLPVYTADQFPHVRLDCCDRCRRYLKTVDLTKTGLADPIVDELATIPLDLWAREHGYEKLELNLLQL
jgi:formate dehydrogenase maturation protein FdhE